MCVHCHRLFVLHRFVEGMGVHLGRCIDGEKAMQLCQLGPLEQGDARCEVRAIDNLKVERETDN